jgi:transposase
MRLTIRKIKGKEYVYFHESYRDVKTKEPKHRTIKSFGRLDKLLESDPDILSKLRKQAEEYNREQENKRREEMRAYANKIIKASDEAERESFISKNYGISVYKHIWQQLKLDYLFNYLKSKTNIEYDYGKISFFLSSARIISPMSKLSTYMKRDSYLFSGEEMELQSIYKSLSALSEDKQAIEKHIYKHVSSIRGRKALVAFYDVSTYRFESVKCDGLKEFGYSKDGKPNEVQVTMGLLIDDEGIPLGYEIFPGNISEFKTMEPLLRKLKERYEIKELTVVADRGLNSRGNLALIKELGYEYIMSHKLRSCSEAEIQEVLNAGGYERLSDGDGGSFRHKRLPFKESVYLEGGKKLLDGVLIVSFSEKRRCKDENDRRRSVEKAQEYINNPSKYRAALKRGSKGYVRSSGKEGELCLDFEKIEKQARLDGYYGIVSSKQTLSNEEIISIHHKLWKIEDSFRTMKSDLEVRPCFVWTEGSIRGHFVSCFIALLLERFLERQIKDGGLSATSSQILDAVRNAKVLEVKLKDMPVYIKADTPELFDRISEILGLKVLPSFSGKKELQEILGVKVK